MRYSALASVLRSNAVFLSSSCGLLLLLVAVSCPWRNLAQGNVSEILTKADVEVEGSPEFLFCIPTPFSFLSANAEHARWVKKEGCIPLAGLQDPPANTEATSHPGRAWTDTCRR